MELVLTEADLRNPEDRLLFFKGYVIRDDKMFVDEEFLPVVKDHLKEGRLPDLIPGFNGNFLLVFCLHGRYYIANDRWGTYPVYYWKSDREIRFSTEWKKVAVKSSRNYSRTGLIESLAFGHVLDNRTLLEDVFELAPASINRVGAGKSIFMEEHIYWKLNLNSKGGRLSELTAEFSELWNNQLDIYLRYIREKEGSCFLPLSGGMDSRILINEIDKRGIDSYAFTYGSNRECFEVRAATKVARLQNHCREHRIIKLDEETVAGLINEPPGFDLISCCRSGQKEIFYYHQAKHRAKYFMPGFSGDFMAGSHLRFKMRFWKQKKDIINYILKHKVSPVILSQPDYHDTYEPVLIQLLGESLEENTAPMSAYIRWGLENRQRKYIVRPEATMGHKDTVLFLPFFDYKLMDFFTGVPLKYLWSTRLYVEAQHRYLFNNNRELLSVERGSKIQKPIKNGIWEEYRSKIGYVTRSKSDNRYKIWEEGIDWKHLIAARKLPAELDGLHINENLDGSALFYIINIGLFNEELGRI